jgi:hypothetical protein
MKKQRRFTGAERSEIWDRLEAGETLPSIARSFGRYPSAIRAVQLPTGGVRPYERTRASPFCLRGIHSRGGMRFRVWGS